MTLPIIVWFRHDLRLDDNPALHAAVQTGAPIIPIYIYDDDSDIGGASQWWLHHSLKSLQNDLPIIIRRGAAGDVLNDLIQHTGAKSVYWNRCYEPKMVARDTDIKSALKDNDIDVQSFKGSVLFEPWDMKTGGGTPFKVFTPFYKACLSHAHMIGEPFESPSSMSLFDRSIDTLSVDDLELLPNIPWDKEFDTLWHPGAHGAHEKTQDFLDERVQHYKEGRDRPDQDNTSRLSPHLHFGEISPRRIWTIAGDQPGAEPFVRQLFWREFSIQLLFNNPDLPTKPLQPKFNVFPWADNPDHLKAWQRGMTGYPIIDAGMRQLWRTGWMHNRVRMVVGSFLVKHLLLPWQDGEAWFWDTLLDADLPNNAASWQWIAGCGADAAPYFRVFNPIVQGEKFDPNGDYVRAFVPELANVPNAYIHKPWEWPGAKSLNYPGPIVDHKMGRERALAAYQKVKNNEA